MIRRALLGLTLLGLISACGVSQNFPALPQAPALGWKAYPENAAHVTVRLPVAWRFVDAKNLPAQADVDALKAAGDPMGNYLANMAGAVSSGVYIFEAVDPSTVVSSIPFATSTYLAYIPGYGVDKTPQALLKENLSATTTNYKLTQTPIAHPMDPPSGFDHVWQVEYAWTATKSDGSAQAQLAGLHYLLLRNNDAWILGFTTMLATGSTALPTWQQIGGSISAPALPLVIPPLLIAVVAALGIVTVLLIVLFFFLRRRHARRQAAEEAARPKRGHHR